MRKPQKVCGKCFELLLPMQPYLTATVSKAMLQPDFSEASMFEWAGKPISRSFKLELKRAVRVAQNGAFNKIRGVYNPLELWQVPYNSEPPKKKRRSA